MTTKPKTRLPPAKSPSLAAHAYGHAHHRRDHGGLNPHPLRSSSQSKSPHKTTTNNSINANNTKSSQSARGPSKGGLFADEKTSNQARSSRSSNQPPPPNPKPRSKKPNDK